MLLSALCASAFLRFCILNVIRKTMRKREEEKKRGAWVEYDGRKSQCTHCCTLLGRIGMNKYARPETGGGGVGWVKWKPPKRMFILCNANWMRTTDVACRIRSVLCGTGEFKLFFIAQRKEITSFSLSLSNRFSGLVLEWKIAKFFGRLIEISRSLQNQKKKKKSIRQIALQRRKGTHPLIIIYSYCVASWFAGNSMQQANLSNFEVIPSVVAKWFM